MIEADGFCQALAARGISFFTGVPCSYLSGAFAYLEERGDFVAAPNEGVALALAAGAELAGRRAAVLVQNSGLGNLLDPLTSLAMAYEIPVLIIMSLRGWPTAADDEPHHEVMGRGTQPVLDGIGMAYTVLAASLPALGDALDRAERAYRQRRGFVMLVPRDTLAPGRSAGTDRARPLRRREAVSMVARHIRDELVFTTTGMISREMFGVMDAPGHFYMQGSMGHAIGLGLGTALARGDRRVIVVDGDGASLMHLGALALVGDRRPPNLTHIILDNGVYDSTGGQLTRCRPVPWDQLALALGYRTGAVCETADGLDQRLKELAGLPGPHLVGVRLTAEAAGESPTPPRVTSTYRNPDIRARFQAHAAPRLTRPSSAGR